MSHNSATLQLPFHCISHLAPYFLPLNIYSLYFGDHSVKTSQNPATPHLLRHKNGMRAQIVDLDSYQLPSLALDQLALQVSRVPIIRVYGLVVDTLGTPRNILIHVHNYYPYIYVDCFENRPNIRQLVQKFEYELSRSHSRRRKTEEGSLDSDEEVDPVTLDSTGKRRFLASISLCKGTSVYGFNVGFKPVYKISVLSPLYKTRLVKLIQDGRIDFGDLSKPTPDRRNIYESHIPYILQFLTDYNLYGCSWLDFESCYWRSPLLHLLSDNIVNRQDLVSFLKCNLTKKNVLNNEKFPRTGNSLIEVDILTAHISNRSLVSQRNIHTNLQSEHETPPSKYISSLKHLMSDLKFQCNLKGIPFCMAQLSKENQTQSRWDNQDELNAMLDYICNGEKPKMTIMDYDNYFLKDTCKYPTAFEMVDLERQTLSVGDNKQTFVNFLRSWSDLNDILYDTKTNNETTKFTATQLREPTNSEDDSESDGVISTEERRSPSPEIGPIVEDVHSSVESSEETDINDDINSNEETEMHEGKEHHNNLSQLDDDMLIQMTQRPGASSLPYKQSQRSIPLHSMNPLSLNTFTSLPPLEILKENILRTLEEEGLPRVVYSDPFYDKVQDVNAKGMIFAGKKIVVPYSNINEPPPFEINGNDLSYVVFKLVKAEFKERQSKSEIFKKGKKKAKYNPTKCEWNYMKEPPSKTDIKNWLRLQAIESQKLSNKSQIERVTASNDFKASYRSQKVERSPDGFPKLTTFNLEIFCATSQHMSPNPNDDPVSIIFYQFDDSNGLFGDVWFKEGTLIFLDRSEKDETFISMISKMPDVQVFTDEHELVWRLVSLVKQFDPDILTGYEINASSWGYIIERFRNVFDINLCAEFSRVLHKNSGKFGDKWGFTHSSIIKVPGRHMINIWRHLKGEVALTRYSLENVAYHILHVTMPLFSRKILNDLFDGEFKQFSALLDYFQNRSKTSIKLLKVQDIITRNVEQSRLIGIDFFSNYHRGSQYKIESIMARIAKPENLLLNSPSKQDVHEMRSLECIPLVMEPDSNFYKSPLVVLDFQSLYPSIMLAYNYCYSTLLGRVKGFNPKKNEVGYLKNFQLPPDILPMLKDNITLSPNGYMFVNPKVRKSLLAKMLSEILEARMDVKNVMSKTGDDQEMAKLYNSRQLALKLFANVTYGYTSASFSGRMPNSDVADSIVATGRQILTQSIKIIDENPEWGAKVVYGDTDSLFVYLPGKSKQEGFRIGREISNYISGLFPDPVKLKFEKVYHPSILLSKKRYVGYSFEHENQAIAKFDAKGIETIRRDGIPAQLAIVERSLRMLFDTKNLSQVKAYVMEQFYKVTTNQVSVADFCFAKEVKYGFYKDERYLPPGAVVARRKVEVDARAEPQYKERIPYVVIQDSSKIRVRDRCLLPEEFVASFSGDNPYRLDHQYYITRVLSPPLERLFNLIGADVKQWYRELPRVLNMSVDPGMERFFHTTSCVICGEKQKVETGLSVCAKCLQEPVQLASKLQDEIITKSEEVALVISDCSNCSVAFCGLDELCGCQNYTCSNFFRRLRTQQKQKVVARNKLMLQVLDEQW